MKEAGFEGDNAVSALLDNLDAKITTPAPARPAASPPAATKALDGKGA
jgi:hypothetical protein